MWYKVVNATCEDQRELMEIRATKIGHVGGIIYKRRVEKATELDGSRNKCLGFGEGKKVKF